MSKKRPREPSNVDVRLVEILEDLANENEPVRLKAAHSLISIFSDPRNTSSEQIKVIVTRLFRGLCSGRKAARLGFSVALTEFLCQLEANGSTTGKGSFTGSEIIDILERSTIPEGSTSGQDERDHYFGRLFGADALLKSKILIREQNFSQWKRLLGLICEIAAKKPWLRQECGWILFSWVRQSQEESVSQRFALSIIDELNQHKIIRTPEGVAIWLEIVNKFPRAKLPKDVWRHRDPLASKEISMLADVLKDAKPQAKSANDALESQGTANWSAQLHFVWPVVLSQFVDFNRRRSSEDHEHKRVDFSSFWLKSVDDGLFKSSSSTERKYWGLLLLNKALAEIQGERVELVFTKNAMQCLFESLKGDDRYLHRTAQKVLATIRARAAEEYIAPSCFKCLVKASNFEDFDTIPKTKTLEKLAFSADAESQVTIVRELTNMFAHPGTEDEKEASLRRRKIVNMQGRLLSQALSTLTSNAEAEHKDVNKSTGLIRFILKQWIFLAFCEPYVSDINGARPAIAEESRDQFKERLSRGFEQALRCGGLGRQFLREAVACISYYSNDETLRPPPFGASIGEVVRRGWQHLSQIPCSWDYKLSDANDWQDIYGLQPGLSHARSMVTQKSIIANKGGSENLTRSVQLPPTGSTYSEGLALLYSLTLFQVHTGDPEAVEILEDLLKYDERSESGIQSSTAGRDDTNALVEIILSFASRPSKFLRRVTLQIFEAFASQITEQGLQSFIRILATTESAQGQLEMFESGDVGSSIGDEDGMEVNSDVEVVESDDETSSGEESLLEVSDGLFHETDRDVEDEEELAAFDAKLAAALGTHKVGDETSDSSDSDMDDEEMFALDEKLQEVFRTRENASSKKKESKEAKENVVNFKNRVLDFVDSYLKHEYLSHQSLGLIIPLLTLARKTNTKQLAGRACTILRDFCSRCKGHHVPTLPVTEKEVLAKALQVFDEVHQEAGLESSNSRAAACSSASILLVKTLLGAGVDIDLVVDVYAATRKRQLTDKKCKVQAAFFSDWNNWCAQAKKQLAK